MKFNKNISNKNNKPARTVNSICEGSTPNKIFSLNTSFGFELCFFITKSFFNSFLLILFILLILINNIL